MEKWKDRWYQINEDLFARILKSDFFKDSPILTKALEPFISYDLAVN